MAREPRERGQPGQQPGRRAATCGVLPDEGDRTARDHLVADHDHVGDVGQGPQDVLEQGHACELDRGLVGTVEADGAAAGEHDAPQLGRPWSAHARSLAPVERLGRRARWLAVWGHGRRVPGTAHGPAPRAPRAASLRTRPGGEPRGPRRARRAHRRDRPAGAARGLRPRLRGARLRPGAVRRDAGRALRQRAARAEHPQRHRLAGRHVRGGRRPRPAAEHPRPGRRREADGVPEDPPLRLLRLPRVQDDQRG